MRHPIFLFAALLASFVSATAFASECDDPATAKGKLTEYSSPYRGDVVQNLDAYSADKVKAFVEARQKLPQARACADAYEKAFGKEDAYHVKVIREADGKMKEKVAEEVASAMKGIEERKQEIDSKSSPLPPQAMWNDITSKCNNVLQLDPSQSRCKELLAAAVTAKNNAGAEEQAKIAGARLPKAVKFTGKDSAKLEKDIVTAYKEAYPGEPVRKVAFISSDWIGKVDKYAKREFNDVRAWVVVEQSNRCRAFSMTFRKERTLGEKAWGPLKRLSNGDTFPMLCENIDK